MFKEHRQDFIYAEGKSNFSHDAVKKGHKVKQIEETMAIIRLGNNQENKQCGNTESPFLENLFNDVIIGRNDPVYRRSPKLNGERKISTTG